MREKHGTRRDGIVSAVPETSDRCPGCGGRLTRLGMETDLDLRHEYWQCMSCGQTGCANYDVMDGSFRGHFLDA